MLFVDDLLPKHTTTWLQSTLVVILLIYVQTLIVKKSHIDRFDNRSTGA